MYKYTRLVQRIARLTYASDVHHSCLRPFSPGAISLALFQNWSNTTELLSSRIDEEFFLTQLPFLRSLVHSCFQHSFDGLSDLRSPRLRLTRLCNRATTHIVSSPQISSHCGVDRFPQRPQSSRPLWTSSSSVPFCAWLSALSLCHNCFHAICHSCGCF